VAGRLRLELIDQRIARLTEQLSGLWRLAELAHPDKPLSRGFARVTGRDGHTLTHARAAREAQRLTLHFGDGSVDASVDGEGQPKPVERRPRKSYMPPQPGLFDGQED
jgi:exodeoxyribonuclease VII large subunit